jgi:hypothetical protein
MTKKNDALRDMVNTLKEGNVRLNVTTILTNILGQSDLKYGRNKIL